MPKITFKKKIIPPLKLVPILDKLKRQGKKIVYCHGVFDLFHRGHIHQFEQARSQGDVLVVGLTTDRHVLKGPSRPTFNQNVRAEVLAALELVDFVTFSDAESAVETIKLLKPDVYVKGKEYEDTEKDLTRKIAKEVEAVKSTGGRVFYSVELPIRSTPLLNSFVDPYPEDVLEYLKKIKKHYSFDNVVKLIDRLRGLKVLVIGEAIIDQYDYMEQMDVSPKGGVVAMHYLDSEFFAGGSLACANHISNFCKNAILLSPIGRKDPHEKFIRSALNANVKGILFEREGFSTIVKKREVIKSYLQKRAETYFFDDSPTPKDIEQKIIAYLKENLNSFDLVFVIDYGHGFITDKIAGFLSRSARPLAVNTQMNSANKGFHVITRYPRLDYACLDHAEASMALRDRSSRPELMGRKLLDTLSAQGAMITLGHRGSVMVIKDGEYFTPVFSRKVVDTVGAGDALFSVTSLAFVDRWPPELIGFVGNAVGALATTYIGNKGSVTKKMLVNFMRSLMA